MPRRYFPRLLLVALLFSTLIALLLGSFSNSADFKALQSQIESLGFTTATLRLAAIGTLLLVWPQIVSFCRTRQWVTSIQSKRLLLNRWRIGAWLLAIELLLGLDGINLLIQLLKNLAS